MTSLALCARSWVLCAEGTDTWVLGGHSLQHWMVACEEHGAAAQLPPLGKEGGDSGEKLRNSHPRQTGSLSSPVSLGRLAPGLPTPVTVQLSHHG